jgi:hypothetical protein
MYAIFTRDDGITPRDVVPTDAEGIELIGGPGCTERNCKRASLWQTGLKR